MIAMQKLCRTIVTVPRLLPALLACSGGLSCAHSADVQVIGVFGGKATLVVDGGRPRTLSIGESTPDKIRLISVSPDSVVVETEGKRQTVQMGNRITSGPTGGASQRAVITADTKGHFFTTATVNGVSMPFMVDTGATMVTISSYYAKSAGIAYTAGERGVVQTANGVTAAYKVKFDTVRIGDITLNNVDGVVMENQQLGKFGLLGLSFLNRIEMRREGDSMTLTRRY
jgi:aspartyl protease family protein